MADQSSAQERTEEATPRRRQQARKKGTVAKSQDLTSAIVVFALMVALPPLSSNMGQAFMLSFTQSLRTMPKDLDGTTLGAYIWGVGQGPALATLPLFAVIMGAGLVASFAQVGFVMSGEALTPTFGKLNPINGFKRIFSSASTMEGAKALAKSLLFGWLAWSAIQGRLDDLIGLSWAEPKAALGLTGEVLHQVFVRVGVAWLAIAGIDYLFQRKQVDKQLRMTKEELKQEMKEQEQSVEIKMAMARQRRKLSERVAQAVAGADVIVTNPTHFSVALKFEAGKMHAPQVVAKGQDFLALRIRELAAEHRVPIVPNPPLARQLYKRCEVGDFVPRELFQAVAEVLAHVYRTLKAVR